MATLEERAPKRLAEIRDAGAGRSYPRDRIVGLETALILFAAGFYGRQDAYWIAEAGIRATCVDVDDAKLRAMRDLYPKTWRYIAGDAYATALAATKTYELVSIDSPTGAFDRVADMTTTWCRLATRVVVMGASLESAKLVKPPSSWKIVDVAKRSDHAGGVYWLTLENLAKRGRR